MQFARNRGVKRGLVGLVVEVIEFAHAAQHVGAPVGCSLEACRRVEPGRRLQDPGEQRRFARIDVGERLAEVGLGAGGESVGALAEELGVHEQREDLVLGQFVLELTATRKISRSLRRSCFSFVIRVVRTSCWVSVLPPWEASIVNRGDEHRAHDALPVDARVLEEAVVLGGQHGLHDHRRDLLPGNGDTALLADLPEQAAVAAVHAQRHLQAHVAQQRDVRQGRLQVVVRRKKSHQDQARQRHHDGRGDAQPALQSVSSPAAIMHSNVTDRRDATVAALRRPDRDARHGARRQSSAASAADRWPEAPLGRDWPPEPGSGPGGYSPGQLRIGAWEGPPRG